MSVRTDVPTVMPVANGMAPPTAQFKQMGMQPSEMAMGSPAAMNEVAATIEAAQSADHQLGEANVLSTTNPDHPLDRSMVVTIRASLNELCLRKAKATWSPAGDAMKSILQQARLSDPMPFFKKKWRLFCSGHSPKFVRCPWRVCRRSLPISRAPPRRRATSRCRLPNYCAYCAAHLPDAFYSLKNPTPACARAFAWQSIVLHKLTLASQSNDFPLGTFA